MDADQDDTPYSRSGVTSSLGGCTQSLKVWLPIAIEAELKQLAATDGAGASEIVRDMIFLTLKGMTYGEYCAKSRRELLSREGAVQGRISPAGSIVALKPGDKLP